MTSTRNELIDLIEQGIVAPADIDEALRVSEVAPAPAEWRIFIDRLLLWLGALLLGLSLIFFFAYNWEAMGVFAQFALVQLAMFAAVAAYWKLDDGTPAKAALTLASLCLGALLALYHQTYQTGADPWQLFGSWTLLMLPWAFIARFAALWMLWLALLNLTVMLYYSAHPATFELLFLPNDTMQLTLFLLNAAAMLGWERLGKRFAYLAQRWAFTVLAAAALLPVSILVMKEILDDRTGYGFASALWLIWMGVLYLKYRRKGRDLFVLTLGALSLFVVWLSLVIHWLDPGRDNIEGALFVMFLAATGMGSLLVVWLKNLHKEWAA